MNGARRLQIAAIGLVGVLWYGCGGALPEGAVDLAPAFGRGGFLEQGRYLNLGRVPGEDISLDPGFWVPVPLIEGEGWLEKDHRGWNPVGERSTFRYRGFRGVMREPLLELRLHRLWKLEGSISVDVRVEGRSVGRLELGAAIPVPSLPLPVEVLSDDMHFELVFDPPIPAPVNGGRQDVSMAGFRLSDAARVTVVDEDAEDGAIPFALEWSAETNEARIPPVGGELIVPLSVPVRADALEVEVRCPGADARVDLTVLDMEGELELSDDLETCGRGWRTLGVAMERVAGREVVASLTATPGELGAQVELRRPRFTTHGPEPEAPPPAPNPVRLDRPDILVVILDAARGREFGFAGYHRDTSPNLDRLADESLVFEQAYSECATTSCSIPNLITGLPFLNVGTVFKGRQIPDEVVTLAEYLEPLGYSSVGLSGNPNNSRSRNGHQGFDRFPGVIWGAHNISDRAIEFIEAQPADVPMFMQLHYLPPHTPYRPTEEFDIFTDPAYEGPVQPKMALRRYNSGKKVFTPADVEQLLALYDGNLRMVDDAVDQVFEALKEAGRWENTLVILTSDHGEAFGEHGVYTHNSTLYEEMIHIPFVVRLPGGEIPTAVDVSRPVTLADLVPTVLGRLGLPPAPEVWGVDLLRERPERYLFHRTYKPMNSALAARWKRWKAIVRSDRQEPRLFDLLADPEERLDLATERPLLFAGLSLRLRNFIVDWEERVPQSSEDVELSAEDEAMLKSLGYVE